MLNFLHRQRGVSMIELLIGLVIIAILMSIGAPALSTWIQNSKIRTAAEAIQGGLQLARAEAVRRNSYVQFVLAGAVNTDSTWTIGCVTVDANCPDATIQTHSGAEGTTGALVNTTPQLTTVAFTGLGRLTPASTAVAIDITNPAGGTCRAAGGAMNCLRVTVSAFGQVRMCDPSVTQAVSPKGC